MTQEVPNWFNSENRSHGTYVVSAWYAAKEKGWFRKYMQRDTQFPPDAPDAVCISLDRHTAQNKLMRDFIRLTVGMSYDLGKTWDNALYMQGIYDPLEYSFALSNRTPVEVRVRHGQEALCVKYVPLPDATTTLVVQGIYRIDESGELSKIYYKDHDRYLDELALRGIHRQALAEATVKRYLPLFDNSQSIDPDMVYRNLMVKPTLLEISPLFIEAMKKS